VFDLGDEDPGAPTAIVLHGFARSRYDALSRLGPILPHARRVILPDLPGHGDASGRGTRLGTDEDAFVESLVTGATSGPVLLVGHSLGAVVAIEAAGREALAPRVRGVLALAPYERLRTPLAARLDLRAMPTRPLLGPAIGVLGMLGVVERSTREAAARAACPVAVLAGDADPVTPVAEARAIAESASTSRFTSIAHARHDDFHTLGRAEMEAALAWIESCG
jgi:pimeloyl-ACP methyl ester carboxylesterase